MDLYLIDGNSYLCRPFYAIRGLTDSRGRPTNAVFGFTKMLLKIIRDRRPDALAVSFDSPCPTERQRLFEQYKAPHRLRAIPPEHEDHLYCPLLGRTTTVLSGIVTVPFPLIYT
jgi:hypothetical protein